MLLKPGEEQGNQWVQVFQGKQDTAPPWSIPLPYP